MQYDKPLKKSYCKGPEVMQLSILTFSAAEAPERVLFMYNYLL